MNSRSHRECQILHLQSLRRYKHQRTPQSDWLPPPLLSDPDLHVTHIHIITTTKTEREATIYPEACSPCTWHLWVDFLSHVLWKVTGHLSSDVYEHSGVRGGDLVDEHGAGVGQQQLCMVGFELRTVLHRGAEAADSNRVYRLFYLTGDLFWCSASLCFGSSELLLDVEGCEHCANVVTDKHARLQILDLHWKRQHHQLPTW